MPASHALRDPVGNYNFSVEIGTLIQGNFKEFNGLSMTRAVNEYREGHEKNLEPRKLPGLRSLSNVTLRRGMVDGKDLFKWFDKRRTDKAFKQDVDIVVYDEDFNEIARWALKGAWPVRWNAPTFDASSTALAVEELELAFSELTMS